MLLWVLPLGDSVSVGPGIAGEARTARPTQLTVMSHSEAHRVSRLDQCVLQRAIDRFERTWYDGSYMRDRIDASPRAAWLFSRAAALRQFRRDVSIEPWYAAGITAVRHEDCGPCTQLGVTMAERAGVSPAVLRAVLADN